MRTAILLITIALLSIAGYVFFFSSDDGDAELADMLAKRQLESSVKKDRGGVSETDDFGDLGTPRPLPPYLRSAHDPSGYWFVGKSDSESGVEIPFEPNSRPRPPKRGLPEVSTNPGFLGTRACGECHQERHDSFIHAAHFNTSRPASVDTIGGSFRQGKNIMPTHNPEVYFEMIGQGDQCFQRVSFYDWKFDIPFHIVTGSGKLGQTYLYWNYDRLYQMNVSYLPVKDTWANSPGYVDSDAAYARQIGRRCLECHTTFIQPGKRINQFVPDTIIYGISCERCHGPGKQHVDYYHAHPQTIDGDSGEAKFITTPSDLSRQQQIDVCGQCHSAVTPAKQGHFKFRPGDRLEDFYETPNSEAAGSVHTSNQVARMSASECFINSQMTCNDCHDPHQQEHGKLELFSQRCMKCHQADACGMHGQLGDTLKANCIDCHMPSGESNKLWMKTQSETVFPFLRDHHIRVDQDATAQFLNGK